MGKCAQLGPKRYSYLVASINIVVGLISLIGGIVLTIYNPFLIYYALAIIQGILWIISSVIFFTGEIKKKKSFILLFFVLSLICWCVCCIVAPFIAHFGATIVCLAYLTFHAYIWKYYKGELRENVSGRVEEVANEEEQLQ